MHQLPAHRYTQAPDQHPDHLVRRTVQPYRFLGEGTGPVSKRPALWTLYIDSIKRTIARIQAYPTPISLNTFVIRFDRSHSPRIGVHLAVAWITTRRKIVSDGTPDEGTGQFRIKNPQRGTQLVGIVRTWFHGLRKLQRKRLLQVKINRKLDKACILNSEASVQLEMALQLEQSSKAES